MMVVSCANDVIAKFMGQRLDSIEVIFFRFFFSFVTLIPLALRRGMRTFRTPQLTSNILRGVIGALSFYLYTYSLVRLQIVEVVTILWTIPLFSLLLSIILLHERVTIVRWIATIAGFIGLVFISTYDSGVSFSFKIIYFFPVASAFLFALQDIMIKKMIVDGSKITMLMYFSIVTSLLTLVPAILVWKTPTMFELTMLMLFGLLANLMQYFIFKAFECADLSALAPFRYVEFILSALAGFIFFAEFPAANVLIGATILIPSTLCLAYNENKKIRKAIH
jgi:S-adenosylmethionine uptake transporter